MYEYQTIIYKEGTLNTMGAQNVNPANFSKLLNKYAQEGWRLRAIEKDKQKSFFGGTREAYLLVLEKKIS